MCRTLLCVVATLFTFSGLSAQGNCVISNLVAEAHPCVDGLFLVDIDFDIQNPEGDIFGVVGNATNYGFFSYDSLPITLGPLEGDGITDWEFIVYDLGEPNCQATYELGVIDCCSFANVTISEIVCTGLDEFRARFNFIPENTGNVGFSVFDENNVLLGTFPYAALPVTVNGIPSEGIRTMFVTFCDIGNPNCCTDFYFEDPDCNPNDCEIYNVVVDDGPCETGQFYVHLNFQYENVSSTFTVIGNGMNYGTFEYSDLPVQIGPLAGDGMTVYEFLVTDASGSGCTGVATFGPLECPPSCGFLNIEAQPIACQSDETYSLNLSFTPVAVGNEGYSVFTQGQNLGSYSYEQNPLLIEEFPLSGNFFDELVICDNADSTCCDTIEFPSLRCYECLIYNLEAIPSVCDSNGEFTVTIDFDFWNVSPEGFQIGGNGNDYGQYSYDDVPVTLGPFQGDSSIFYEFVVIDLGGGFCLSGVEMGYVDCDCGFEEISVEPLACSGNGSYQLLLDFVPVEVTNDYFDVYAGGELLGYFAYADLPVVVENFPESGGAMDVITICDNDNPTCCASYEFAGLSCGCTVFALEATPLACDPGTQTFDLVVNFQWEGDSVSTFRVYLGDEEIGQVNGSSLPDTLHGLTSPGGTEEITVCANEIPDCCTSVGIEVPEPCGEEPCSVTALTAEVTPCQNETQTFGLVIDFDYTGEGVAFFDVFLDNVQIAIIPGSSLPALIDGLTSTGGTGVLRVCANDQPECCDVIEVALPQCPEPCEINALVATPIPCDPETETFELIIDFDWNGSAEMFQVFLGGELAGVVSGASLPDTLDGLTSEGGVELVRVCAVGFPECCALTEIVIDGPCGEIPCAIYDLTAEILPCDTITETFGMVLNFNWDGESEFFDVFFEGQQVAFISGADLPVTISDLVFEGGIAHIQVCANDKPDCCQLVEVSIPEPCGVLPCDITALEVDVHDCNPESGTFGITVNVSWEGNIESFDFTILIGGDTIQLNQPGIFPYLIDGLPAETGGALIRVCAHDKPDCCAEQEFQTPECPEECRIFEVIADPGGCTGDSTFTLALAFAYEGLMEDSVQIWTGDTYLGVYAVNPQPVVINDFPWNGNVVMPVRICEKNNAECCRVIEFEVPACLEACDIQELIVEATGDCNLEDQTFEVFLNVVWAGDVEGFEVYADGEFLTFVGAAELPLTLESFPLPGGEVAAIEVCAVNNPDCCAAAEFAVPDCMNQCSITEMSVDTVFCTSDIALGVMIHFQSEFLDGDLELWANGYYLGVYPDISPLFVQNIPSDDGLIHLLMCSVDHPDCCADVNIEGMVCGDCGISNLTATPTACNAGMFSVILDFDFGNVSNQFSVVGNGNQYGSFGYADVPIILGPFAGDSITPWEFVVQDGESPGCLDFFDLGLIYCDPSDTTTAVGPVPLVRTLEIYYGVNGPFVRAPEDAGQFELWTYDGRLVAMYEPLSIGEVILIKELVRIPGLYLARVKTADGFLVGKVAVID